MISTSLPGPDALSQPDCPPPDRVTRCAILAFEAIPDSAASVGVNRLPGEPRALRPGIRLFEFIR